MCSRFEQRSAVWARLGSDGAGPPVLDAKSFAIELERLHKVYLGRLDSLAGTQVSTTLRIKVSFGLRFLSDSSVLEGDIDYYLCLVVFNDDAEKAAKVVMKISLEEEPWYRCAATTPTKNKYFRLPPLRPPPSSIPPTCPLRPSHPSGEDTTIRVARRCVGSGGGLL